MNRTGFDAAVFFDRECFTANFGSASGVDDGVGMGTRVRVDTDDVIVLFCHEGPNGDPSFPSVPLFGGITSGV